jgi:hypothetical protein
MKELFSKTFLLKLLFSFLYANVHIYGPVHPSNTVFHYFSTSTLSRL